MSVPEVLLSGNHGEIEKWRQARRVEKTRQVRPDLLK
jgi:tRNA (guanine37-N1)-methyltransferase